MNEVTTPVVFDASALLDSVLGERRSEAVDSVLRRPGTRLHAPEIVDQELLSAARRLERTAAISTHRLEEALRDAGSLFIELHPLRPHFDRVWSLRHRITVADSYYLSVAETIEAPLLTTDGTFAKVVTTLSDVQIIDLAE